MAKNRIRTGSPGMVYTGGDASTIHDNSIEACATSGIEIQGSCSTIDIYANYFEGAPQLRDIFYRAAGTNFSHTIHGNYFHSTLGVELEAGCNTQALKIKENNFFSSTTGVKINAITGFSGVRIEDNLFRDVTTPYDIPNSAFLTAGLVYPNNILKIENTTIGTTDDSKGQFNTSILTNDATWATFAGTGSSSDNASNLNHSGILMYDLVGTSSWTAFVDFFFDPAFKEEFITVNIPFITSGGTNITVTIDDGITTKGYTCNSAATGAAAMDNVFYFLMSSTANKIRLRFGVGTQTVNALLPSIRRGCHDNLAYRDLR